MSYMVYIYKRESENAFKRYKSSSYDFAFKNAGEDDYIAIFNYLDDGSRESSEIQVYKRGKCIYSQFDFTDIITGDCYDEEGDYSLVPDEITDDFDSFLRSF